MRSAAEAWEALPAPWQAAFDEAWASWNSGCFGIGAVAVDRSGAVVARGRNRVLEPRSAPGVIADSITAHAEMNLLASMSWGQTSDIELYTTLEPCLMCASAILMAGTPVVHYAGSDDLFAGLAEILELHPAVTGRQPTRHGPMDDGLGRFAQLLPLSFVAFWMGTENRSIQVAAEHDPALTELALRVAGDGTLDRIKDAGGDTLDAVAAVWSDLQR